MKKVLEKRKILYIFFLFVIFIVICSKFYGRSLFIDPFFKKDVCLYTLKTDLPEYSVLEIANNSKKNLFFEITLDDKKFLQNTSEVLAEAEKEGGENIEEKIFNYILKNKYHYYPFSGKRWQHSPALFFNSLGFGYCDDFSAIFSYLAKEADLDARVHGLSGHVVTEVYNEKWKMYDSDYGVYFLNSVGEIASVKELENDSSLILDSEKRMNLLSLMEKDNKSNPYTEEYVNLFSSVDDNKISNWYSSYVAKDILVEFNVPSDGKIFFPAVMSSPPHNTFW